ncbi:zinc finger transcriptional activator, partial [Elasticomyces elasticus]
MATTTSQFPYSQTGSTGAADTSNGPHTRTYQACIPCRRRKASESVRCDLGSVDNPHDPPCVRCRRESKECFFSATRRKRKPADFGLEEGDASDYEARNGRKRPKSTSNGPGGPLSRHGSITYEAGEAMSPGLTQQPRTPGGSVGQYQPLRRPTAEKREEDDYEVNDHTAAMLQIEPVTSVQDALHLLAEAAGTDKNHAMGISGNMRQTAFHYNGNSPVSMPSGASPNVNRMTPRSSIHIPPTGPIAPQQLQIDPSITQMASDILSQDDDFAHRSALKAWSRFRFVRNGWFTAQEGMDYIDYFYKYLSPLSPIVVPDFRHRSTHVTLLSEEPMLVITMLMVASRHMKLEGPGSLTRPYAVHGKLWTYLQGQIDRMIWGQEQFGGGFCGAGAHLGNEVDPLSRRGLRTLGTVESLMLLTEWHPRAMHFPPDEDDELMIPEHTTTPGRGNSLTGEGADIKGIGGRRIDAWLEPCWRSDRMCWMLLGNAMSLAFEVGVFDEGPPSTCSRLSHGHVLPNHEPSYERRKQNIKKLLLIYVTQTSGRLGLTSMLSHHYSESALRNSATHHPAHNGAVEDTVLDFWLQMADLMKTGNQLLFTNREHTKNIIKNGQYAKLLQSLHPKLQAWREGFDTCTVVPTHMRHILDIEYEYCRVYLNSLALQAVVERCTNNTPKQAYANLVNNITYTNASSNRLRTDTAIPPSTLMKWYGNDRHYIREVSEACRNLLRIVVEGLYPGEYLKHAPVRTYFRIISVAIILLKTFALGATEDDVAMSLSLMDQT